MKHEFAIVENKYIEDYDLQKYHCVYVDDNVILKIIKKLKIMKTYSQSLNRPDFGLSYWGITLIPPKSLALFQDIILTVKIDENDEIPLLVAMISEAIEKQAYIVHYGI